MYSYQDVDLDDYDDDDMGQKVVSLTNKGLLLEKFIYHQCRDAGIVPMGFSPSSSVSGVDLKLFIRDYNFNPTPKYNNMPSLARQTLDFIITPFRGENVGIELKIKASDDFGQSQMEWNKSTGWSFYGKQDSSSVEKRNMLKKANADTMINLMWRDRQDPKLFGYLKKGLKSTQVSEEDRNFDKNNYAATEYKNDGYISIIENYYTGKACPYLNISERGLYYFKSDPLNLKERFGIPSFRNSVKGGAKLRFRYKPGGGKSYGFTAAMKTYGGIKSSPVNLMDDTFVMDLQEDAILCSNAPYPLQQLRKKYKP